MTVEDDSDADDVLMCNAWDAFSTSGDAKNDAEGDNNKYYTFIITCASN